MKRAEEPVDKKVRILWNIKYPYNMLLWIRNGKNVGKYEIVLLAGCERLYYTNKCTLCFLLHFILILLDISLVASLAAALFSLTWSASGKLLWNVRSTVMSLISFSQFANRHSVSSSRFLYRKKGMITHWVSVIRFSTCFTCEDAFDYSEIFRLFDVAACLEFTVKVFCTGHKFQSEFYSFPLMNRSANHLCVDNTRSDPKKKTL